MPEDGFRFFQTECTAFSVSVVIEQIDLYGKCNLYASTSKPNPGPLDNSSVVVRNEDLTSDRRLVILKGVKKVRFLQCTYMYVALIAVILFFLNVVHLCINTWDQGQEYVYCYYMGHVILSREVYCEGF